MYLRKNEEADANGNIYYNKHAGDVEEKEAKGFSDSATIVMDEIRNYITSYVITAYAISRGVRSEKTEFTFVVGEDTGWVLISSDLCYI